MVQLSELLLIPGQQIILLNNNLDIFKISIIFALYGLLIKYIYNMKKYFVLELERRIKLLRQAALEKKFETNIKLNWCIQRNMTRFIKEADEIRKHLRESLGEDLQKFISTIEEKAKKPFNETDQSEWKETLGDDFEKFDKEYIEFLKQQEEFLNEEMEEDFKVYEIDESKIEELDIDYAYFELLVAFIKNE